MSKSLYVIRHYDGRWACRVGARRSLRTTWTTAKTKMHPITSQWTRIPPAYVYFNLPLLSSSLQPSEAFTLTDIYPHSDGQANIYTDFVKRRWARDCFGLQMLFLRRDTRGGPDLHLQVNPYNYNPIYSGTQRASALSSFTDIHKALPALSKR